MEALTWRIIEMATPTARDVGGPEAYSRKAGWERHEGSDADTAGGW